MATGLVNSNVIGDGENVVGSPAVAPGPVSGIDEPMVIEGTGTVTIDPAGTWMDPEFFGLIDTIKTDGPLPAGSKIVVSGPTITLPVSQLYVPAELLVIIFFAKNIFT